MNRRKPFKRWKSVGPQPYAERKSSRIVRIDGESITSMTWFRIFSLLDGGMRGATLLDEIYSQVTLTCSGFFDKKGEKLNAFLALKPGLSGCISSNHISSSNTNVRRDGRQITFVSTISVYLEPAQYRQFKINSLFHEE